MIRNIHEITRNTGLHAGCVIDNKLYAIYDIKVNCDCVAKLICRDEHNIKHVFMTAAPVAKVGGYHGEPTLELTNGEKLDIFIDNPDASDLFVWGMEAKLNAARRAS